MKRTLSTEDIARAERLFTHFGPRVAGAMMGIPRQRIDSLRKIHGWVYVGPRLSPNIVVPLDERIARAMVWERDTTQPPPSVLSRAHMDAQARKERAAPALRPVIEAEIDASRARITVCPPSRDLRFSPDPGYVGAFALAGIGRDVRTGRAWA